MKEKVLITGASRGIGRAIAETLVKNGYEVIGTSRFPDKLNDKLPEVKYLPLDLTDPQSIDKLVKSIGDIDILINNAGVSQIGPVEEVPMENVRRLFELNLFGVIHLTKAVLPSMRKRNKGFIINISSMAGKTSVPFSSIYAATKHGLDGFTKALRIEMKPFGIKATTLFPAYIKTTIPQEKAYKDDSAYIGALEKVRKVREHHIANAPGPEIIAEKVLKILKSDNPKVGYAVGGEAPLNAFLIKVLPSGLVEHFVMKKFKLK
jgi:short-subunit dehydrogenase